MFRLSLCEYLIWIFLWEYATCQHLNIANSIEPAVDKTTNNNSDKKHSSVALDTHLHNHRTHDGTEQCGGSFRDHQVLIKSPNYPNSYPSNLHCEYVFYSPFVCTSEFHIQFLDFQLEPSVACAKDRLTIGDEMHRIETLCGQVIGIMKYKVLNGILRINFTSDKEIENDGFKLLVTRLPCMQNDTDSNNSIESPISPISSTERTVRVLPLLPLTSTATSTPIKINIPIPLNQNIDDQSYAKSQPFEFRSKNNGLPIAAEPLPCTRQLNPNSFQSIINVPSQRIPNCCRTVYNQQHFTLISPGFPAAANYLSDCAFYIERSHVNVCRLRVEFKYLNLGERRFYRCTNSFLEIDGQQFCGCDTGYVHYTQWGPQMKTIRFVNWPIYSDLQGFVLNVVQEECPRRLQAPTIDNWRYASQPRQNFVSQRNDPRRCSYDYVGWLMRSHRNIVPLAQSACLRY